MNNQFFDILGASISEAACKFNLKCVKQSPESWGAKAIYKNDTTGIRVIFEEREMYVFLEICRLIDGDFPPKPGEMTPNTILNCYDFEDLVSLKDESRLYDEKYSQGKDYETIITHILQLHFENLILYGEKILSGDFTEFDQLDTIVKKRARDAAITKWGTDAKKYGWEI